MLSLFILTSYGLQRHSCLAYDEANLVHVQSFEGDIGAGNFTYYRLTLEGFVIIRLVSLEGDADLYLSSSSLKPTWEAYESKSTTCGPDELLVDHDLERPIGIGVYGYVTEEYTIFQLSVFVDPTQKDSYPTYVDVDMENSSAQEKLPPMSQPQSENEEEESLLWTIFIGFLKLLFDVLL